MVFTNPFPRLFSDLCFSCDVLGMCLVSTLFRDFLLCDLFDSLPRVFDTFSCGFTDCSSSFLHPFNYFFLVFLIIMSIPFFSAALCSWAAFLRETTILPSFVSIDLSSIHVLLVTLCCCIIFSSPLRKAGTPRLMFTARRSERSTKNTSYRGFFTRLLGRTVACQGFIMLCEHGIME